MLGVCKIMLARSLRAKACPCKDMDFCYFLSKLTYYMLAFARYSGPRNDIDMYVIWRHGLLWNRHYDGCTVLLFVALRHWLNERSTRTFSALPRRMLVVCAVNSSEIVFVASMWQAALARYQQYLCSIVSSNSCYNQGHRGRWSTVGPTFVRMLRGIFFMHKGDSLQHICKNWTLWKCRGRSCLLSESAEKTNNRMEHSPEPATELWHPQTSVWWWGMPNEARYSLPRPHPRFCLHWAPFGLATRCRPKPYKYSKGTGIVCPRGLTSLTVYLIGNLWVLKGWS